MEDKGYDRACRDLTINYSVRFFFNKIHIALVNLSAFIQLQVLKEQMEHTPPNYCPPSSLFPTMHSI